MLRILAAAIVLLFSVGPSLADRAVLVATRDATLIESVVGALADGAGPHVRAGRTNQARDSIRRDG